MSRFETDVLTQGHEGGRKDTVLVATPGLIASSVDSRRPYSRHNSGDSLLWTEILQIHVTCEQAAELGNHTYSLPPQVVDAG